MCAYTHLKKTEKKIFKGFFCLDSTERPKISVSGVKDTAKTNID